MKSSTDKAEPTFATAYSDIEEPSLINDLTEKELPIFKPESSNEIVEPRRANP
jgi:hypothetical protein